MKYACTGSAHAAWAASCALMSTRTKLPAPAGRAFSVRSPVAGPVASAIGVAAAVALSNANQAAV